MQLLEFFVILVGPVLLFGHGAAAYWVYENGWEGKRSASISLLILMPFGLLTFINWAGISPPDGNPFLPLALLGFMCLPFGMVALIDNRTLTNAFTVAVVFFILWRTYMLVTYEDSPGAVIVPWIMLGLAGKMKWEGFFDDDGYVSPPSKSAKPRVQIAPPADPFEDFEKPPLRKEL